MVAAAQRRAHLGRSAWTWAGGVVALVAAVSGCHAAAAVSHTRTAGQPPAAVTPASSPTSSPVSSPVTTATPVGAHRACTAPQGRTAVGVRVVTVVDRAAGTPARGPMAPTPYRTLRTTVWFPAATAGSAVPVCGHAPLVVFAHGFDVTPATYSPLAATIAAAGYVVAAPLFPISGAGLPGQPREDDMPRQVLDIRSVISAMTAASTAHGWLAGALDPRHVAVVGHSDGAETAAAMLLVPADRDPRVQAVAILAGQVPTWGRQVPTALPVLVEQGDHDTVNPPSLSQQLYARLVRPKAYLDVLGGSHLDPVIGPSRRSQTVRAAVVAFLDETLRHSRHAAALLRTLGNQPGMTALSDAL